MNNWKECLENNSVLKRSKDERMARSLKEIALGRIELMNKLNADKENANYIFEGYYSSINELLHAIAALKGYKILNHVCLGFFLKEFLNREDLFRLFDDFRFKRNGLLYYGKGMDFEIAKETIKKAKGLIKELETFLQQ